MIRTAVADRQTALRLPVRRLREVVKTVLTGEGVTDAAVSLALVDDPTIHDLNRRFLSHDEPTDVITFDLRPRPEAPLEGEIVISTDTARAAAGRLGHAPEDEALLYVIHGLLHLCGYDDRSPALRKAMRAREQVYLDQLGIRLRGRPTW
jgi:probable rRNA maturation factor